MKSIESKIKYYSLLMTYNDTSIVNNYLLPKGYHFSFYKDGDMDEWIRIHIESREFTSYESGVILFHEFYDSFINELPKRCLFIEEDSTNKKIGTATLSLLKEKEYGYDVVVDWLAISEEYQGKGLARPLITRVLNLANELGHKKILLHTQTSTWLAAKLYLDMGFDPLIEEDKMGWRILKTITNHNKLKDIKPLELEDIYDKRNTLIEQELIKLYGEDFHYLVWYQNGEHKVYTYHNGISESFEYIEEKDKVILNKINKK